jgi:hypothetical protein
MEAYGLENRANHGTTFRLDVLSSRDVQSRRLLQSRRQGTTFSRDVSDVLSSRVVPSRRLIQSRRLTSLLIVGEPPDPPEASTGSHPLHRRLEILQL